GVLGANPRPRARVAVLEREAVAVGAVAENDRKWPFPLRTVYIRAQHEPVGHLDRNVPIDAHPVGELAFARGHVVPVIPASLSCYSCRANLTPRRGAVSTERIKEAN